MNLSFAQKREGNTNPTLINYEQSAKRRWSKKWGERDTNINVKRERGEEEREEGRRRVR
jgi:hypothetical protein